MQDRRAPPPATSRLRGRGGKVGVAVLPVPKPPSPGPSRLGALPEPDLIKLQAEWVSPLTGGGVGGTDRGGVGVSCLLLSSSFVSESFSVWDAARGW